MKETLYRVPIGAPFDGTGAGLMLLALLAYGVARYFYQKNRLHWKAFWLHTAGVMTICDGFLFPVGLFFCGIFLGIPKNLGMVLLVLFAASFVAGLVATLIAISAEDSMRNREQKLRGMAEEGRLMIIYGNLIGFGYVLYCLAKFIAHIIFPPDEGFTNDG